jgi:hypothetical protein
VQWNELDYVIFPWLVPGVRTEFTYAPVQNLNAANLLRIIPGVAMLIRPNVRAIISADIERAHNLPAAGSWSPAGGSIGLAPMQYTKLQAEQISATLGLAF